MLPTLSLGPWQVHTYALANALALLVAGMFGAHRLLRLDVPSQVVVRGLFYTVLGGFAGVFAVRVVPTLQQFLRSGTLAWVGGSSFVGAVGGGSLVGAAYCWKHHIPLGRAFDLGGVAVPLGQAVGRLGCLARGCCYGRPTDSWPGLYLPDHDGVWLERYPTQLLALVANLLILAILLAVERRSERPPFDGFLFLLYVDLYCAKRFALEFLRGDALPVIGPVSWVHLYTVAGMIAATAMIFWNLRRQARKGAAQAAT